MALTQDEIQQLLQLIRSTRDSEINCERCLTLVAEFAERQLSGQPIPEALKCLEHHLSICAECQEEYAALQRAIGEIDEPAE